MFIEIQTSAGNQLINADIIDFVDIQNGKTILLLKKDNSIGVRSITISNSYEEIRKALVR